MILIGFVPHYLASRRFAVQEFSLAMEYLIVANFKVVSSKIYVFISVTLVI